MENRRPYFYYFQSKFMHLAMRNTYTLKEEKKKICDELSTQTLQPTSGTKPSPKPSSHKKSVISRLLLALSAEPIEGDIH